MINNPDNSKHRPRSRFIPKPRGSIVIGPRDAQLLVELFLHRAMRRCHIERLFFGSVQRCNARLRLLFDHRFIFRHYPAGPFGEAVYTVGPESAAIIASHLGLDPAEVRKECRKTRPPEFLEHNGKVLDFRLAVESALRDLPPVRLERWLPEIECRHEYEVESSDGRTWKEVFSPDGFVRLALGDPALYLSYFVEIDLGHVSHRRFLLKLERHRRYLDSGLFSDRFGDGQFHTLVVTTTEARLRNLFAIVEAERSDLFWFTTFSAIEERSVTEPIWHVPMRDGCETLLQPAVMQPSMPRPRCQ